MSKSLPGCRIIVVESVYHRSGPERQPTQYQLDFSHDLYTDAQPYGPYQLRVGKDWTPLQLGWLEDEGGINISTVILTNNESKFTQVNPTPEELAHAKSRAVLVGTTDNVGAVLPFSILLPGESLRFSPTDPDLLRLRCMNDTAKVTITLLPG